MARQVQLRRGTTTEHSTFTGAVGEVTIDTDKDVVVVHDGATAGGFPMVKATSLATVATTGAYSDLSGTPTLATVATSGLYSDLSGTPTLATVATTGAYSDLTGTPTLATVATTGAYSDLTGAPTLATVATTGDYTDLSNTPTIPVAGTDFVALTGGTFTGNVTVSAEFVATSYNETFATLSGLTPTVNCEAANVFALTTSGNATFTFSNPPATGTAYGFTLKVTAGGAHTLTWPASVDWAGGTAPDAPASGETDVFAFFTHDGGTTWYGFQAGDALA